MTELIVNVAEPEREAPLIDYAFSLARQWPAWLTGLCVIPVDALVMALPDPLGILAGEERVALADDAWWQVRCRAAAVAGSWEVVRGVYREVVAERASLANLVIGRLPGWPASLQDASRRPAETLVHGACPIILVPDDWIARPTIGHVLLAWNSSAPAARAARAALPLLHLAKRVTVLDGTSGWGPRRRPTARVAGQAGRRVRLANVQAQGKGGRGHPPGSERPLRRPAGAGRVGPPANQRAAMGWRHAPFASPQPRTAAAGALEHQTPRTHAMKILLPVDGSPSSHRAVRYVIRHWSGMPSSSRPALILLHVDPALGAGVTRYLSVSDVSRFHAVNAKSALRNARRTLTKAGLLFEERHEIGDPAEVVIRLASRLKCDLVAMGSHGWGALLSLVLGSVVVKVLAHSRVPVLVVR